MGNRQVDSRFSLDNKYEYSKSGNGVHAYIVDTGVNSTHAEFDGRMGDGFSAIEEGGTNDCNGHGTHVAGTVGGSVYGVAKDVTLHAVRVLNCRGSGTLSGVVAGVDWVAQNAQLPAVANMSLGGGKSEAIDDAVAAAVQSGVSFVVAAGNSNADACDYSPAAVDTAITVGATDADDKRASFSNWGNCVDVFGPGVGVKSAWIDGNNATKSISGTSMASPHVAGVVALYLEETPNATPAEIFDRVVELSTHDIITDVKNSPNLMVFTDPTDIGPEPTPEVPESPCGDSCKYSRSFVESSDYVGIGEQFRAGRDDSVTAHAITGGNPKVTVRLMRRGWFRWSQVAEANGSSDNLEFTFDLERSGRYKWEIKATEGKGVVHFWSTL